MKYSDLIDITNIIAISFLFLFSFFLISHKKGKKLTNRILALFLFSTAVILLNFVLSQKINILSQKIFLLLWLGNSFILLWGPLLYLYIQTVVSHSFLLQRRHALHLIPFLAYLVFSPFFVLPRSFSHLDLLTSSSSFDLWILIIFPCLISLQLAVYLILSFKALRKYQSWIKNQVLYQKSTLSWLRFILVGFGLLWSIGIVNSTIALIKGQPIYFLSLANFFFIFSIAVATVFQGLKHPEVFIQTEDKIKYKGSTLNPDDVDRHIERLKECMKNDKPYLNPGLSLVKLSRKLSIQPRHLSQIINASLNQTFIDFINAYRIEEAKKCLSDPSMSEETILEIAYMVGFNSKSAFNNAFKKITGKTPSEFKKSIQTE
jgi:AraC-like DNA-binding protein